MYAVGSHTTEEDFVLIELDNTPLPYAWGSPAGIAAFRGVDPSGEPEAELWFGTHPGSPARVVSAEAPGDRTLPALLRERPELAGGERLPFLLKLLAADRPLSLQAHPDAEQARRGFEAENARGVPLDSPRRNYRDPFPKPEIVVAVSERFDALSGFRPAAEVAAVVSALGSEDVPAAAPLRGILADPTNVAGAMRWLLSGDPGVAEAVAQTTALARRGERSPVADDLRTVRELAAHSPGDPGLLVALLMNRVRLRRDECLYAPAGVLHAYLHGLGVELMTASDNVLRGGMTPKHVAVDELLRLLTFEQGPAAVLEPRVDGATTAYEPSAPFGLLRVDPAGAPVEVQVAGPAVLLGDAAEVTVSARGASDVVGRGRGFLLPRGVDRISVDGPGRLWIAHAR